MSEVTLFSHPFFVHSATLAGLRPRPRVTVKNSVGPTRDFLGINVVFTGPRLHLELVTSICTVPDEYEDDFLAERDNAGFTPAEWPRLEVLDISGCQLADALTGELLGQSSFPALADLDLSGNDLTDAAVDSLLETGLPRQLKRLILGGNDITDAGALALAERWPTGDTDRLENLNLRFTHIGQVGQAALLRRFGGRVDLF